MANQTFHDKIEQNVPLLVILVILVVAIIAVVVTAILILPLMLTWMIEYTRETFGMLLTGLGS